MCGVALSTQYESDFGEEPNSRKAVTSRTAKYFGGESGEESLASLLALPKSSTSPNKQCPTAQDSLTEQQTEVQQIYGNKNERAAVYYGLNPANPIIKNEETYIAEMSVRQVGHVARRCLVLTARAPTERWEMLGNPLCGTLFLLSNARTVCSRPEIA